MQKKLKANELSEFCRELGAMLGSGISVLRAFNIMSSRNTEQKIKEAYTNISIQLKRGLPLSEAMAMQGEMFPEMLVNMLRAGEESGKIENTFERMAVHYEKEYHMTNSVKSAMTYPLILLILIVCVMMALFTFVLPSFFGLFKNMEVPALTRIVMNISVFMKTNIFSVIAAAVIIFMSLRFIFQLYPVKYRLDRFKVHMPKAGGLLKIIYTAQFARTLSSLYKSGINIVDSLNIAKNTIPNLFIREQFNRAVKKVRSGHTLSEALKDIDGFDLKLSQTAAIGEETGKLDQMLSSMADSFEYESQSAINKLITILQPVMIIILSLLVLAVVCSVMLPIFSMYENIEKTAAF